jgi:hypothetical protein
LVRTFICNSEIKKKKVKRLVERLDDSVMSKGRKFVGGFFFFSGLGLVLGAAWGADGASFGAGIFNVAIGTLLFWPVLKNWLNKLPFRN